MQISSILDRNQSASGYELLLEMGFELNKNYETSGGFRSGKTQVYMIDDDKSKRIIVLCGMEEAGYIVRNTKKKGHAQWKSFPRDGEIGYHSDIYSASDYISDCFY